jgi:hypothetical protein
MATCFQRKLVRTEFRVLIETTCMKCGARKLVSQYDGSLDQWEDGHSCSTERETQQESGPDQAERCSQLAAGTSEIHVC